MTRTITHLQLSEVERRLANMRAAMLGLTLSEFVGQLVRTDAQLCGLADLLVEEAEDSEDVCDG